MNNLDLKKLWISQSDETDCGLAALRMALRFFGIETTNLELKKELNSLGLKITSEGVFTPYLALLAQSKGFITVVRYPISMLKEVRKKKHASSFVMKLSHISTKYSRPRTYLFRSLKRYLVSNGKVVVYTHHAPNIVHITNAIKRKAAVLVGVSCGDYYGIQNEDWLHTLTLLPSSNRFAVLDSFMERGRINYKKKWFDYLKTARAFNWNKWHGDLLEIYSGY